MEDWSDFVEGNEIVNWSDFVEGNEFVNWSDFVEGIGIAFGYIDFELSIYLVFSESNNS